MGTWGDEGLLVGTLFAVCVRWTESSANVPGTVPAPAPNVTIDVPATPASVAVMDKLGRRNESYVAAVLGGGGGDLLTVYSTTWWLVWHDRYMKVVSQMSPDQLNVMSLPARQFLKANGVETDEDKWKFPTDGLDNLAEEVEVKRERAIQRLNDLQKEMIEKIRSYWEYLSNSTLSRQPYPHARNVEIYSDGIFRNQEDTDWVMTFSIWFDKAVDEKRTVLKYWLRWSSDCTDMGRLEADMPPFFIMLADEYWKEAKY